MLLPLPMHIRGQLKRRRTKVAASAACIILLAICVIPTFLLAASGATARSTARVVPVLRFSPLPNWTSSALAVGRSERSSEVPWPATVGPLEADAGYVTANRSSAVATAGPLELVRALQVHAVY